MNEVTTLEIVQYPDPILTSPAISVTHEHLQDLPELVMKMREAMKNNRGVGIAANQIGSPLNVCIVKDMTLVNPMIVRKSALSAQELEGCLSVDNGKLRYERPAAEWVVITYRDIRFKEREREFTGYSARIVQHEIRHLEGFLINEGQESPNCNIDVTRVLDNSIEC